MMELSQQRVLGCSRCRYSTKGCSRCRNPAFKPRTIRQQPESGLHSCHPATVAAEAKHPAQHVTRTSGSLASTQQQSLSGRKGAASGDRSRKRRLAVEEQYAVHRPSELVQLSSTAEGVCQQGTLVESLRRETGLQTNQQQQDTQQQQFQQHLIASQSLLQQQQHEQRLQQHTQFEDQQRQQDPQQQQQQQLECVGQHRQAAKADNLFSKHSDNDSDSSVAKRIRRALQPSAAAPTAAAAVVSAPAAANSEEQRAAAAAADGSDQPASVTLLAADVAASTTAAAAPTTPVAAAADGGHHLGATTITAADVAPSVAAAAVAVRSPVATAADGSDQPTTLTRNAADVAPRVTTAGAAGEAAPAAAAASPSTANFSSMLQQRIQQQLSQGRQKLPSGRARSAAAAAAAGSSPPFQKRSRGVNQSASGSHQHAQGAAAAVSRVAAAGWQTPPRSQQQQQQGYGQQQISTDRFQQLSTTAAAGAAAAAAAAVDQSPSAAVQTPSAAAAAATPGSKKKRKTPAKPYKPPKPYTHLAIPGVNPRACVPGWSPPVSPYGLLEEELWQDPWKLLLACMLLNKTSGKQVRGVLWDLLTLCPTPEAAVAADTAAIRAIITPLGLHNKRAIAVQKFSHDFIHKDWTCPTQLYGIGKYAADAYYIFCRGQWEGVQPDDKDLIKYCEWLRSTGGLGTGLTRAVDCSQQIVNDNTAELEL